jgi:hypothetical protein
VNDRMNGQLGLPLEETIIPSPKSVELERTPRSDWLFRLMSRTPHVAETFHVNSQITPHATANRILDPATSQQVAGWYHTTAFHPAAAAFDRANAAGEGVLVDTAQVAAAAGAAFGRLLAADVQRLLYALDVLVLYDHRVWRLAVGADALWIDASLRPGDELALRGCLPSLALDEPLPLLAVVVGVPWRYMLLQGPRGYRRMLVDLGRLLRHLEAPPDGARTELDFYDARLGAVLRLDGVEHVPLAVVTFPQALAAESPAGQSPADQGDR